VFYGWFDNHLAYISSTIKFLNDNGKDGKKFWNEADIYHFIGKDIVYHHFLFLPAMRLGIDEEYKLPDYIPTRGHLTLESKKISKSRNWYIGLKDFLKIFPSDYLRFYLVSINPYSQDDLNFNWDEFATKINIEKHCEKFFGPRIKKLSDNNNEKEKDLEKNFASCLGALRIIKDGWETEAIPETVDKNAKKISFLAKIFRSN